MTPGPLERMASATKVLMRHATQRKLRADQTGHPKKEGTGDDIFKEACVKRIPVKNMNADVLSYILKIPDSKKPNVSIIAPPPPQLNDGGVRPIAVTFLVWHGKATEVSIWEYRSDAPHWTPVTVGTTYKAGPWVQDQEGTYTLRIRELAAQFITIGTARRYPAD
ncbi:hypothetical protein BDZ89DRAFT_1128061 [Hymenopellis radicata]|nr:hypothetical protein BDZ89DRAFT_1128061 [Hymenopellis radicata]